MDFFSETSAGVASAVAAWVALAFGWLNHRTSERALRLAQANAQRRLPVLVPYLIDATAYTSADAPRIIDIVLSLSNPSDSPNTLARAELAITHIVRDYAAAQLLIPALFDDKPSVGAALSIPCRIDAHTTVAGRLRFTVPKGLVDPRQVRAYDLQLSDSQGAVVSFEIQLLREGAALRE